MNILTIRRAMAAVAAATTAFLGLLAAMLLGATPALADEGDQWRITSYDVQAQAHASGEIDVDLTFVFDFGEEGGHGPLFTFVQRQEIEDDPDNYRVLSYQDFQASSSSGAPAQLKVTSEGDHVSVRIGDPGVTVYGPQTYELSMTINGIINAGVNGTDEIYWNVIGSGFEVPIDSASITLTAPAEPQRLTCFTGSIGSTNTCDGATQTGESATFTQAGMGPGEGLTVVAAYDAGTFPGAQTLLEPRRTFTNSWGGVSRNWIITGLASVAGILGLVGVSRAASKRSRGSKPAATSGVVQPDTVEEFIASNTPTQKYGMQLSQLRQLPPQSGMRFSPPPGVSPAALGTLIDRVAHHHDVTAIIVDLAVRGYLTMEEIHLKGRDLDWMLRPTEKDASDLSGYDAAIYFGIFGDKKRGRKLSKLGTGYEHAVTQAQKLLYEEVTERGWFVANPQKMRTWWTVAGLGLIAAGAIAAMILAFTNNSAIFGLIGVVVGIAAIILGRSSVTYTAEGRELAQHAREFKAYLTEAVAPNLTYHDDQVFNAYLPYAVALGVAREWSESFNRAYQGEPVEPTWYYNYSATAYAYWWLAFGAHSTIFGTATSTEVVSNDSHSTPGSSGSSGFSGGYTGGGVGGGGGGGW